MAPRVTAINAAPDSPIACKVVAAGRYELEAIGRGVFNIGYAHGWKPVEVFPAGESVRTLEEAPALTCHNAH